MNKGGFILLLGLMTGAAAFSGFYYIGTVPCRALLKEPEPELAWLKREFNLSDPDFNRVVQLHEAYLPQCAERCRRIEQQNGKLQALLAQSATVTPEMQELLLERARIRAACEAEMLKHFVEVSRAMPPEQGRRYLAWVEQRTILQRQPMEQRHQTDHKHSMGHGAEP